jgi:FXSXX-COOH protein
MPELPGVPSALPDLKGARLGDLRHADLSAAVERAVPAVSVPVPVPVAAFNSAV